MAKATNVFASANRIHYPWLESLVEDHQCLNHVPISNALILTVQERLAIRRRLRINKTEDGG